MPVREAGIRTTGLCLLALVVSAPWGFAEQENGQAFVDVVDVKVVNVEVVVTDADGRPVSGLTRDDFEVSVDGKTRELTNFYAVADRGPLLPDGPVSEHMLPPDATRELTVVVLVDNAHIRPENRHALFERLRQYLDSQIQPRVDRQAEPIARFMVFSMARRLELVLPLTEDRDEVLPALQKIGAQASLHAALDGDRRMFMSRLGQASLRTYQPRPGVSGDPVFEDAVRVALELSETVRLLSEERYQTALAAFETLGTLCEALAGLPGRKALLYLSDGLPLRPADSLIEAWAGKYQTWVLQNEEDIRLWSGFPGAPAAFQRLVGATGSLQFDLQSPLNRLATQASGAKVAFYPVSTGGRGSGLISAEVSGSSLYGAGAMHRNSTIAENFSRDASLLRMAEDTGGLALLRTSNLDDFIDRMRRDFTNYYSLGFSPPEEEESGRFRDLAVKVRHEGLEVRHSKGYLSKNWRQRLGERATAAAIYDLESNPLDVRVDYGLELRDGDHFIVPIMVKIPFERIQLVHRDGHFNAQLTVLLMVSDRDKGLSETHRFDLPIKIPDTQMLYVINQTAAYPVDLRTNRGHKRIAIGVRDHVAGTEAAVSLELVVGRGAPSGSG